MFSKHQRSTSFLELSNDVQDELDWVIGQLKVFDIPLNVTTFAIEPTTKLLAVGEFTIHFHHRLCLEYGEFGKGTSTGSIYIFGGPGVDVKIMTPSSVGVKFLSFASLPQKILCIDDSDQLHIWDLTTFGGPEYLASARFDPVNSLTVSPSLCHVFVGLQTGEVKTYDLACLRKSPYTSPNMWKLFQESVLATGTPSMIEARSSQPCIDQIFHPRDLNLIFVAYAGGVILSNLSDRSTVRAYEMVLPPGAPGGCSYGMSDILTHRQPDVTCLSIHPSGHFFAVGHADGSIAFWPVDDDSRPLVVRTLDQEDVNVVYPSELEDQLKHGAEERTTSIREPIIKLAWSGYSNSSDPRGGHTTLTVLGGLDSRAGGGLTVLLLPPFQPPEPPADDSLQPGVIHPTFLSAMRQASKPVKSYMYETEGEVQDFLLIPQQHLHFSGNYDPYAILSLQATPEDLRIVQAYQFPPPGWISFNESAIRPPESTDDHTRISQPSSPGSSDWADEDPLQLDLPFQLLESNKLKDGRLFTFENNIYQQILERNAVFQSNRVDLQGGSAFSDQTKVNELRLAKYQPRRILVTCHGDLSLRFFDISAQLLVSTATEPLANPFPTPLDALTVEADLVWQSIVARERRIDGRTASIETFSLAPEALELAIVLDNGYLIVYRSSSKNPVPLQLTPDSDEGIIMLDPSTTKGNAIFSPYFSLRGTTPIKACALSDIGFLALSYKTGPIIIVDMRTPKVIFRTNPDAIHKRDSSGVHHISEPDVATALAWSISPIEKDAQLRVRLIVSRVSGKAEIYTLASSGNPASWTVAGNPIVTKAVAEPIMDGTFVLDSKTGARRGANRSLFAASFQPEPASPSILIAVGAKGARCTTNMNGDRLGKADWGHQFGTAISTQVVERMASKALLVLTDKQEALAYSLPHLERITNFKLLPIVSLPLTIDQSGDFVAFTPTQRSDSIATVTYGTFFDIRRASSPHEIDFGMKPCKVSQPQPISLGPASLLGSWLHYKQSMSGEQVDNMLAGPGRPPIKRFTNTEEPESSGGLADSASNAAASIAASAAAARANIYSKITSALNERGQLLGDLGEQFNSLEAGSKSMVDQAKKLAAQQTAKSWFGF